jgi:IS66 Orf2 like protein
VIFYKRLDRATFQVPEAPSKTARYVEIDDATLDALLDGIDVTEDSSVRWRAKTH